MVGPIEEGMDSGGSRRRKLEFEEDEEGKKKMIERMGRKDIKNEMNQGNAIVIFFWIKEKVFF